MIYARVAGTGSYLPEKVMTNADLEALVDTSDEWIQARTGIRQRHIAAAGESTSDLAAHAARRAMALAGVEPAQVDLLIVATTTPDMVFPSTACIVQAKLGIAGGPAFDLQAVCSGFIYALSVAEKFIRTGQTRCALVIGAETYSRILDWTDRGTCVLFGDGAGAVVLKAAPEPGIYSSHLHADGTHREMLSVPGWVDRGGVSGKPLLQMDGGAVFKFAVRVMEQVALEALESNGYGIADLDWLVPHQANVRIIQSTARKLDLGLEKVIVTVGEHGNTSAASIPLALDQGVRDGRIREGQLVLLEGVGGGFTWGSVLLRV